MRPRSLYVPAAVSVALAALVWLVSAPARFLNYDTEYALLWGNDLVHGRTPDYTVAFAPTPHPLAQLVGALGSLFGTGFGETLFEVLAFLSLGILGWLVFALGRAWFGTAAGVVAAAIVLTREPILSYGIRAYVDLPYICLLLGALLIETRRRRAGTPVLALIAMAGLLRPEAWLFAGAYAVWLWRGGALRPVHVALVVGAPLLWALSDLAVTGDPLHSLSGTRSTAEDLGRITGLQRVPATLPRRLGEILREPVVLAAAVGGVLALWRLRARATLGAVAGLLAVGAFCVLAAAGLSILTRYLLLPATILAIFAGAGVAGWTQLPRDDPWRARWMALGALTVVGMLVFIPSQVTRLKNTRSALIAQTRILDELHDLVTANLSCGTTQVAVPNRRAVPQLALWLDIPPRDVVSAQELGRYPRRPSALAPVSRAVADQFVLDARDKDRALPAPPRSRLSVRGRYWNLYGACP
ncbi:MAG TPA: hypothetical protein VK501_10555 [Baekduia sp.]|uniref:hypothetical protein n=1 Tax=Baekduia sp. TaxID=2600305 RepID=UPI002C018749|nr:hypothetical protein [Baekduia sp.]HMJ34348.1 hypothetical protein [Baekduia sp.]